MTTAGTMRRRILAIALNYSPTLFIHLLRPLHNDGGFEIQVATEDMLAKLAGMAGSSPADIAAAILDKAKPDLVFACRYNGPLAEDIAIACRRRRIPFIFHLDDNLMEVPPEQGADKAAFYLQPQRLQALRAQMEQAALAYFSTAALRDRMRDLGIGFRDTYVGPICAAADPMAERTPAATVAAAGAPLVFGYAASAGHGADLRLALPGIMAVLDRFPAARFELVGSIDMVPELAAYGERVRHDRSFSRYDDYLADLHRRGWSLGLAPLCDTPFSRLKTYTKWVEYAAAGIPAIISDHPIYRECGAGGAAALVQDGDWAAALPALFGDAARRGAIATVARRRLSADYSLEKLRGQLLAAFARAGAYTGAAASETIAGP